MISDRFTYIVYAHLNILHDTAATVNYGKRKCQAKRIENYEGRGMKTLFHPQDELLNQTELIELRDTDRKHLNFRFLK